MGNNNNIKNSNNNNIKNGNNNNKCKNVVNGSSSIDVNCRENNNINGDYGCSNYNNSSKKNEGGKQSVSVPLTSVSASENTLNVTSAMPKQKHRGSRRRGKRGGKSKKHFDNNNQKQNQQQLVNQNNVKIEIVDEIPKLEK